MSGIERISQKRGRKRQDRSSFLIRNLDNCLFSPAASPRGNNGRFYASSIGNSCDRYLYLHFNGLLPQKEINGNLRRIFDHGNVTQDRYTSYFKKMGVFVQDEVEARTVDPPISGRADFLLRILPEFPKYIVELKTINSTEFSSLVEPKHDHEAQIQFYLFALDILVGGVLYENKDNQKIKLFHVEADKDYMSLVLERCKKISKLSKPPSIDYAVHSTWCDCLLVPDTESLLSNDKKAEKIDFALTQVQTEKEAQLLDDELFG